MQQVELFKDEHKGQTCAVLGGGVNLPNDLRKIDPVDVLIGVNQHSLILPLDYLVFRDRDMWPLIKDFRDIKLVTHLNKFNEGHVIHAGIAPPIGYSGGFAVWLADYMGFDHTYVCGMDQYQDRHDLREYWWEGPQSAKKTMHRHCNTEMGAWKALLESLRHPERVQFVSGRLKDLKYESHA